jgi:hypothetical protein
MAKKEQDNKPSIVNSLVVPPVDERRHVELCRQCPLCFKGEDNGVGTAYSTKGQIRYYKCDKCSFTWKAILSAELVHVSFRRVNVETR